MSRSMVKTKPNNGMRILLFVMAIAVGYVCFTIVYDLRVRIINHFELSNIAEANEQVGQTLSNFIADVERQTDWKVEIVSGRRSKEAQIQLKRDNPKNAAVNKSRHVLGRAIDIFLYKRVGFNLIELRKFSSKSAWIESGVPEISKRYGLLWGGTYKNYHDPVHFEVN